MDELTVLNNVYNILETEIMAIGEVRGKIESKPFIKEIIDAKKRCQSQKMTINKILSNYGEKPKEINMFVKFFNDIYTDIKLNDKDDSKIAQLLIAATSKEIEKLEEIYSLELDKKVSKITKEAIDLLKYQVNIWNRYI